MTRIVFTCGDINGIGPEIAIKVFTKIFQKRNNNKVLFVCPKNVFEFYYKLSKSSFNYQVADKYSFSNSLLNLIPLPDSKINTGKSTALSGRIAFKAIKKSLELINSRYSRCIGYRSDFKKGF